MSQYTDILNLKAETLSSDDEDYEESLLEISALFHGFDMALTAFIAAHGYTEDSSDVTAKAQFLRKKFKAADIKPPRDFKEWFSPNKKISRKTAFQICFAFHLDVDQTNDFFRCVLLERGFDCHTITEAVYYFCLRNALSYTQAQEMIDQIPIPKKAKTLPDCDILYTGTILDGLNSIDDKEALIQYIKEQIDDFRYNNATAIKYIQDLWAEISKPGGLATQEGSIIARTHNQFEDRRKKGAADTRSAEVISAEIHHQDQKVKPYDYVIADSDASTWIIFSQILGLANYQETEYAVKYDRSLTSVLSENRLMPMKADYCFPSRQSIDKLVRGDLVGDDEIVRKMLIFLVFYSYWAKLIIHKNDAFYSARSSDSERCLDTINARLLSAGYPELYAGNPYDWLFLWSLNDEHPLEAFRTYMGEVFAVKEEDTEV